MFRSAFLALFACVFFTFVSAVPTEVKLPTRFSLFVSSSSKVRSFEGQAVNACNGTIVIGKPYCGAHYYNEKKYKLGKKYRLDTMFYETKDYSGDLANTYRPQPYYITENDQFVYSGYFPGKHSIQHKFSTPVPGTFQFANRDWLACPSNGNKVSKDLYEVYATATGFDIPGCQPIKISTKEQHHRGAFEY